MRKEVKDGLFRPPSFQVVKPVFGKTAAIQDPELGTNRGVTEGIGFSAVVEARPVEEPR